MEKKKFKLISTFILFLILFLAIFANPVIAQDSNGEEAGVPTGMFVHWFNIIPEKSYAEIDFFNRTTQIDIQYQDEWNWWLIPFAVPWIIETWKPKNWFTNWYGPLEDDAALAISEPVEFSVEFVDGNPEGWRAWLGVTNFRSYLGKTNKTIPLFVSIDGPISKRLEQIRIVGKMGDPESEAGIIYENTWDILLKAENFSKARLETNKDKNIKASPNDIISFPIEVENTGYFLDTYVFTSTSSKESAPRQWNTSIIGSVTLGPGESTTVYLDINTPDRFYESSDINVITVEVFSKENLNRPLDTLTVSVTMQGFYLSPLGLFLILILLIILLLIVFFVISYRKYITKKLRKPKKEKKKKEEQKKVKEPIKEVKKEQKIEPVKQQKSTLTVKEKKPNIDKRKEKALQKVRRQQEKQKNKYQS